MRDWIKVTFDLPTKREVALAARHYGKSRAEIVGWLVILWTWADSQTADGFIPDMTLRDVADAAAVPYEFLVLLSSDEIAWMSETTNGDGPRGISFSNWNRHNGESSKKRAIDCRRQQKRRNKHPAK